MMGVERVVYQPLEVCAVRSRFKFDGGECVKNPDQSSMAGGVVGTSNHMPRARHCICHNGCSLPSYRIAVIFLKGRIMQFISVLRIPTGRTKLSLGNPFGV